VTADDGWLAEIEQVLGQPADPGFGPPTVDVEPTAWVEAATTARDRLGCSFFDFLTAVDEVEEGFSVVLHVARPAPSETRSVLLRARVPTDAAEVASVRDVYPGAGWHERETHEMFGISFAGHEPLEKLLLPDEFEGHPLRKDFVLASRVAKPWPGAKEPGESDGDASPSRRRTRPPGVPDDWGTSSD